MIMQTLEPESEVKIELDNEAADVTHIVIEGFKSKDGQEFISAKDIGMPGGSVIDSLVYGTPITTLCGKEIIANKDPKKYPLCNECQEICKHHGWPLPTY